MKILIILIPILIVLIILSRYVQLKYKYKSILLEIEIRDEIHNVIMDLSDQDNIKAKAVISKKIQYLYKLLSISEHQQFFLYFQSLKNLRKYFPHTELIFNYVENPKFSGYHYNRIEKSKATTISLIEMLKFVFLRKKLTDGVYNYLNKISSTLN